METEPKKRAPTVVERATANVNKALGQQGCNYCRRYWPADRVRKKRSRLGVIKWICESCEEGRRIRKGKVE